MTLITVLLLFFAISPLEAHAITEKRFNGDPWCYSILYGENEEIVPNTIIVYLHGDCNSGSGISGLSELSQTEHPIKYARSGKLYLPDDTIIISFQTHHDLEMQRNIEDLEEVLNSIAAENPDARIILGGHSRGGIVSYKVASRGRAAVDGYFFISGSRPREEGSIKLGFIPNALVVYGSESPLDRREGFSNLFQFDITEEIYEKSGVTIDKNANNALYVDRSWSHTATPIFLLEDFFWEWLDGVIDLSEVNN